VQALVNTVSRHHGTDLIATATGASSWLAAAGLITAG
jgi:hypothetical protein